MKLIKFSTLLILFCGLLSGAVAYAEEPAKTLFSSPLNKTSKSAGAPWETGWYDGADGYAKALAEYEKTNKPMAVYINVTWCPYCRKFEKDILSNEKVQAFMKDVIKVKLNPESGRREMAIAFQYGVMGYPSFYVHPPQPSGTVRLYTGISPQQFIELFQKVLK